MNNKCFIEEITFVQNCYLTGISNTIERRVHPPLILKNGSSLLTHNVSVLWEVLLALLILYVPKVA